MANRSTDARSAFAVAIAIVLGFGGLVLTFSDLGPGESWPLRITVAAAFFFISGAFVGLIQPKAWPIALLTAWGAVLMGGFITLVAAAHYGRGAFAATEPPLLLPD
ncbi:MAG: hypothetical protein IPM25_14825 [Chloracidobacterium sp.]|nr:hypothetical protein [Chloracidobacterium sp.]